MLFDKRSNAGYSEGLEWSAIRTILKLDVRVGRVRNVFTSKQQEETVMHPKLEPLMRPLGTLIAILPLAVIIVVVILTTL